MDVLMHTNETRKITFVDDRSPVTGTFRRCVTPLPLTPLTIESNAFVFRVLRFQSRGSLLDWRLDSGAARFSKQLGLNFRSLLPTPPSVGLNNLGPPASEDDEDMLESQ